jgi:hypothetical protein
MKDVKEILKLIEDSIAIAKESGDSQREAELNSLKEKYSASVGEEGNLPQDMLSEAISDMESLQGMLSGMEDVATTKAKKEQIAKSISDVGNIILGARDLATGNRQIRESEASQEAIEPFTPQRRFQRSSELARRIRETRQEGSEAGLDAQVAGVREAIENQFQQDVNNAAVASAGQSGAYQALAQVASRNRIRNLLNLNQQKAGLRDQNRRNQNFLASQDVSHLHLCLLTLRIQYPTHRVNHPVFPALGYPFQASLYPRGYKYPVFYQLCLLNTADYLPSSYLHSRFQKRLEFPGNLMVQG